MTNGRGGPRSGTGAESGGGEGEGRHPAVSDFGISETGTRTVQPRHPGSGHAGHVSDARFALADALRRITTTMVGLQLSDDDIRRAAEDLGAVAGRLEGAAPAGRRPRAHPDPAGHPQDFFPTSPVIGFANPVAPPVLVEVADGELRGSAYFDYQYEGPPTCVHGGVIAMVFDELLGAANIVAGRPAMTGTLTVRYRKPTPLRTPLRLEARCVGQDGRKITTTGAIYEGETLLAEADGLFIELVPERFLRLVAATGESPELAEQVRSDASRLGRARPEAEPEPEH